MTQRETTQVRQSSVSYKKNSTVSLENDISTPRSSAGVGTLNVRQGNTSQQVPDTMTRRQIAANLFSQISKSVVMDLPLQ